jgi:excisionase family DNA binding protein
MPLLTPVQASELTGRHRSTINRAIEKGHLSATRDEFGHYLIDPAELERVYGTLRNPDTRDQSRDVAEERDATTAEVAAPARDVEVLLREMLQRERDERERERVGYERDRRAWDDERSRLWGLIERHTEQMKLLTDQRERASEQPRSRFARWFSRSVRASPPAP